MQGALRSVTELWSRVCGPTFLAHPVHRARLVLGWATVFMPAHRLGRSSVCFTVALEPTDLSPGFFCMPMNE